MTDKAPAMIGIWYVMPGPGKQGNNNNLLFEIRPPSF